MEAAAPPAAEALHQAVWKGDLAAVRRIVAQNPASKTGMEIVQFLLQQGADPISKNGGGWTALQEVIASGNKELATMLYLALNDWFLNDYSRKLPELFRLLKELPDFYLEVKWSVYSWVPLVSRFCPNDHYKIWKRGSSIRVDTTLVGFENLSWIRGHQAFIFCGDDMRELVLVDFQKKFVDQLVNKDRKLTPDIISDDVENMLKQDLGIMNIDTKETTFSPSKSWFGYERFEMVGSLNAKLYDVHKVVYRTEQRTSALMKEHEKKKSGDEKGAAELGLDLESRPKRLEEDTARRYDDYFFGPMTHPAGKGDGLLYPSEKLNKKAKEYKATIWLAKDFPHTVERLMPIIELAMPSSRAFMRVKELLLNKMPKEGFPVKADIPIVPTVSLMAEITQYEETTVDKDLFVLPPFPVVTPEMKKKARDAAKQWNKKPPAAAPASATAAP